MNNKIEKLLHEGFSMKTLTSFNEKQIDVLYEKISKKETKEETTISSTKYNLKDPTDQKKFVEKVKTTEPNKVKMNPTDDTATVGESELQEKSVSKKQQKAMGIALAAKRGDIPKSELKGASKEMVKMSEKDLEDFASTKHKGLPEKKKKKTNEVVKNLEESIMKLIENHLPPTTTKSELLKTIKSYKR
jgi:hypothetical protein